jgi:glycosyltransferase involved in cell wall biosynthesis
VNKFSIIVPTLNSYSVLNILVNSIKSQTWQKWEVVFIDGGSKEKHIRYLEKICNEDKRFSFYKQSKSNKGIFGAMNQGIEIIDKNSWLLFLGSDDKLSNKVILEKINFKINELNLNNKDLLICRGRYFDIKKNIFSREAYFIDNKVDSFLKEKDFQKLIFKGFTPPHQSTLFNGKSRILESKYNDNYSIAGDLEFFCKISKYNKLSIANCPVDMISISTGGVSDRKYFLRLKEVISCYLRYFKFNFFLPFIFRYLNRLDQML